jgi:hypothetical protein
MVVMMAGMMIFGMFFMHGGHGGNHDQGKNEQKHDHAGKGPQHMQHDHGDAEHAIKSETTGTK